MKDSSQRKGLCITVLPKRNRKKELWLSHNFPHSPFVLVEWGSFSISLWGSVYFPIPANDGVELSFHLLPVPSWSLTHGLEQQSGSPYSPLLCTGFIKGLYVDCLPPAPHHSTIIAHFFFWGSLKVANSMHSWHCIIGEHVLKELVQLFVLEMARG